MLVELAVKNLGIIQDLRLDFGTGMTALTGETGAGKTLITEAISLLMGAKANTEMVGPFAEEAEIEARIILPAASVIAPPPVGTSLAEPLTEEKTPPEDRLATEPPREEPLVVESSPTEEPEAILRRVIPRTGRSRAYLNNKLASTRELTDATENLIDLHGQHLHQSLLRPAAQRAALDRFGDIDLTKLKALRRQVATCRARLAELGGDEQSRRRAIDMLSYQIQEITEAQLSDPGEEEHLKVEEKRLAEVGESKKAAVQAGHLLGGDSNTMATLEEAYDQVRDFVDLVDSANQLRRLLDEAGELARTFREYAEATEADPTRLEEIVNRRNQLVELRRKYGDNLAEVMAFADAARTELEELLSADERREFILAELADLEAQEQKAAVAVGKKRRAAAKTLATELQSYLNRLAMPNAVFEVAFASDSATPDTNATPRAAPDPAACDSASPAPPDPAAPDPFATPDPAGEKLEFLLSANPPLPPASLGKVSSGGELSRVTLALQIICRQAPPTVIFDEVDAGVGGTAALAVGDALRDLSKTHQVFVVTHQAQIAAKAAQHLNVSKQTGNTSLDGTGTPSTGTPGTGTPSTGTPIVQVTEVRGDAREEEIARMLSGFPDSQSAKAHAKELLA